METKQKGKEKRKIENKNGENGNRHEKADAPKTKSCRVGNGVRLSTLCCPAKGQQRDLIMIPPT